MLKSSSWPIDQTLSSATSLSKSGPGSDGNEDLLNISRPPALLDPHHQIFSVIFRTRFGGESHLSSDMQSVYSTAPANWVTEHSLGDSYPSVKMQSLYSAASAVWATGHLLENSYSSVEMQSVYSTAQADWIITEVKVFVRHVRWLLWYFPLEHKMKKYGF